jgi:DNA polymerase III delta subunit
MAVKKRSTSSPRKSSAAPSRAGSGAPRAPRARAIPATHDGLKILEAADRGVFPATLYVEGPSEPLKAAFLAGLRHAWATAVPEAARARVFSAGEAGIDEILAAFQNTSLFTPRELVLVLDVEDFGRSEKRVAALAAGLAHPGAGSTLVLVESASDAARKTLEPLRAVCATRWTAFPLERRDLLRWGERRLRHEGLDAEAGVLEGLADACEGDPLAFFNELDKMCTIVAGPGGSKRITREDLSRILKPVVGADLPDYLAAVALGDPGVAAQRLGRLLAAGVGEGLILWSLSNLVGGALGGWSRHRDLSMALARRMPPRALAEAMDALYRAEAAWKGGRADPVAVLEQGTRALCAAR